MKIFGSLINTFNYSQRPWSCNITKYLTYLTIFTYFVHSLEDEPKCLTLNTCGGTYPIGDIIVEYGNPVEIFCNLNINKTNATAHSIYFTKGEEQVHQKFVQVINSTSARLYYEKLEPGEYVFFCNLRGDKNWMVCLNNVKVGYQPQPVQNFTCVSRNWENINCSWIMPENPIITRARIEYTVPQTRLKHKFKCSTNTDETKNFCLWTKLSKNIYKQTHEIYNFRLNISNPLNYTIQKFKIKHYECVIPDKPINYTIVNKTSSSVFLSWKVSHPMNTFPLAILRKIIYRSEFEPVDTWHTVGVQQLTLKDEFHHYNITGLKYSYALYDIRIYLKVNESSDDKWSEPATLTVKTLPEVPGAPPVLTTGSFEIYLRVNDTRYTYVYWQQIPRYLYNGDKFEYHIKKVDKFGKESDVVPEILEKTYAKFNLSYQEVHLRVYSKNDQGLSKTGSNIIIPSNDNVLRETIEITKLVVGNGTYELGWAKRSTNMLENHLIESYTIYYCDNLKYQPFPCKGQLNFVHVSNDTFTKNITVPENKDYQFAVSANSKDSSTGMIWAECVVAVNDQVSGKIKEVIPMHVDSTSATINWNLNCPNAIDLIKYFQIDYCLIKDGKDDCEDGYIFNRKIPHTEFSSDTARSVTLVGLIPYSTYKVNVTAMTAYGLGEPSNQLRITTLEGAPSPPQNVRIHSITNVSMIVSWDPPKYKNGVIKRYKVEYFNKIDNNDLVINITDPISIKLDNLKSYTNYSVNVSACTTTTLCSVPAKIQPIQTLIGAPGKVNKLKLEKTKNETLYLFTWSKPDYQGGHLNYYEVNITWSDNYENSSEIITVKDTMHSVPIVCKGSGNERYQILVRAVNIRKDNNNDIILSGNWSDPYPYFCTVGTPYYFKVLTAVFALILAMIVIFVLAFCGKRIYMIIKEALDTEAKIPDILQNPTMENEDDPATDLIWPSKISDSNNKDDKHIFANYNNHEEMLLITRKYNIVESEPDRDSFGDSSRQDNFSSSPTSSTNILPSEDSGPEYQLQSDSPATLRLINVSKINGSVEEASSKQTVSELDVLSSVELDDGDTELQFNSHPTADLHNVSTNYLPRSFHRESDYVVEPVHNFIDEQAVRPLFDLNLEARLAENDIEQDVPNNILQLPLGYSVFGMQQPSIGASNNCNNYIQIPSSGKNGYVPHPLPGGSSRHFIPSAPSPVVRFNHMLQLQPTQMDYVKDLSADEGNVPPLAVQNLNMCRPPAAFNQHAPSRGYISHPPPNNPTDK